MARDRIGRFVSIVWEMAEDDTYGYSQKPPSGRWGPDFDCGSFIYKAASEAGYDVGWGKDKVRFTGSLAKDFKDAGFQILPFANVGLGDLEIGDILLNLALHAEVYVGEGQSVGAMGSETGGFTGEAGDQTGHEIERHPVYEYERGWDYVVRPPRDDEEVDESSEEDGKGDAKMPSYPNMGGQTNYGGWQGRNMWTPMSPMNQGMWPAVNSMNGYPQGMNPNYGYQQGYQQGYPQGNMGQMNGYSQANAGYGSQQPGMQSNMPMGPQGKQSVMQASSLEEASNVYVAPGDCVPIFNWKDMLMYWKSADKDGIPSLNVFKLTECSEDFPQHAHGEMYGGQQMQPQQMGGNVVTRQEIEQLKEMISNVQSAIMGTGSADGYRQGGESSNGSQSNANANAKQQSRNANGRQN